MLVVEGVGAGGASGRDELGRAVAREQHERMLLVESTRRMSREPERRRQRMWRANADLDRQLLDEQQQHDALRRAVRDPCTLVQLTTVPARASDAPARA